MNELKNRIKNHKFKYFDKIKIIKINENNSPLLKINDIGKIIGLGEKKDDYRIYIPKNIEKNILGIIEYVKEYQIILI